MRKCLKNEIGTHCLSPSLLQMAALERAADPPAQQRGSQNKPRQI